MVTKTPQHKKEPTYGEVLMHASKAFEAAANAFHVLRNTTDDKRVHTLTESALEMIENANSMVVLEAIKWVMPEEHRSDDTQRKTPSVS